AALAIAAPQAATVFAQTAGAPSDRNAGERANTQGNTSDRDRSSERSSGRAERSGRATVGGSERSHRMQRRPRVHGLLIKRAPRYAAVNGESRRQLVVIPKRGDRPRMTAIRSQAEGNRSQPTTVGSS